jgi:ribonuclease VapC
VIVVDTSALVAIIAREPDAAQFGAILSSRTDLVLSAATAVEAYIVVRSRRGQEGVSRLDALLDLGSVELRAFDAPQMELAIDAHRRFGRGSGHPAKLNYGDCFAYALARRYNAPLLFKGDDFVHTDIRPAL